MSYQAAAEKDMGGKTPQRNAGGDEATRRKKRKNCHRQNKEQTRMIDGRMEGHGLRWGLEEPCAWYHWYCMYQSTRFEVGVAQKRR
jgi:hypothetical protein